MDKWAGREKGLKKIFEEIIAKNFLNMGKEIVTQVQEAQRVPGRINARKDMLRYTVIKLTKIKEKYIETTREKWQLTYKGTPTRLSADFSTETLQARREWHDIFKVMKGKNLQPKILNPARLSFRFDGEIQSFPDKQKLREFSTTKNSFVTNTKGTSRGTKHKRRKRPTENKPQTIKKMVIESTYG